MTFIFLRLSSLLQGSPSSNFSFLSHYSEERFSLLLHHLSHLGNLLALVLGEEGNKGVVSDEGIACLILGFPSTFPSVSSHYSSLEKRIGAHCCS
jgi:hypothetical protein